MRGASYPERMQCEPKPPFRSFKSRTDICINGLVVLPRVEAGKVALSDWVAGDLRGLALIHVMYALPAYLGDFFLSFAIVGWAWVGLSPLAHS